MHDWRLAWATADMLQAAYALYAQFDEPSVTREELQAELLELIEHHLQPQMDIAMTLKGGNP